LSADLLVGQQQHPWLTQREDGLAPGNLRENEAGHLARGGPGHQGGEQAFAASIGKELKIFNMEISLTTKFLLVKNFSLFQNERSFNFLLQVEFSSIPILIRGVFKIPNTWKKKNQYKAKPGHGQ
jgi:hypothetical protein